MLQQVAEQQKKLHSNQVYLLNLMKSQTSSRNSLTKYGLPVTKEADLNLLKESWAKPELQNEIVSLYYNSIKSLKTDRFFRVFTFFRLSKYSINIV